MSYVREATWEAVPLSTRRVYLCQIAQRSDLLNFAHYMFGVLFNFGYAARFDLGGTLPSLNCARQADFKTTHVT